MKRILVTGMSGTGKSTALHELGKRGHRVVDTDTEAWSRWITLPDGSRDWIWREHEIENLLAHHREGILFVSGCKSNQGRFYPQFDEVVLLSVPAEVLLERITYRDNNPYGKSSDERRRILDDLATVEPLLRSTATVEIDATEPVTTVVRQLERLGRGCEVSGRNATTPRSGKSPA